MGVEAAGINWYTVVGSSAVIAATISTALNVGFGAWTKHGDRRREDAKEAKKVGHVYLNVALSLQAFAKRCSEYINDIDTAFAEADARHNRNALDGLKSPMLTFEPEPAWIELPIPFVAQVKGLVLQYAERSKWISQQHAYWADLEEAYEFEKERAAVYGLKASALAASIRSDIKAGPGDANSEEDLECLVKRRREQFIKNRKLALIPELKELFEEDMPGYSSGDQD